MKFTKIRNRFLSVFTAIAMFWTATVASIKITTDEITAFAAEETIVGDLNGDQHINGFDLAILKRKIAENDVTAVQTADVTGEGIVDTYDAREVQQFLLCRRTAFTASTREKLDLVDTSIVSTDEPIEISLTVEMAEKADELGSAVAIYNYLYNNMRSEFYYGSRKGAIGAFEQGGGNSPGSGCRHDILPGCLL